MELSVVGSILYILYSFAMICSRDFIMLMKSFFVFVFFPKWEDLRINDFQEKNLYFWWPGHGQYGDWLCLLPETRQSSYYWLRSLNMVLKYDQKLKNNLHQFKASWGVCCRQHEDIFSDWDVSCKRNIFNDEWLT